MTQNRLSEPTDTPYSGTWNFAYNAQLKKLGKRLTVGEVTIGSRDMRDIAAYATLTYAIPPKS